MKADLDRLMVQRGIGAVVVPMHEALDPSFRWLTNGARVTRGYALKTVGRDPILLCYPMERDEAAATGLYAISVYELGYLDFFRQGDAATAYAQFFARVFERWEVKGSVAFLGSAPIQLYYPMLTQLEKRGWKVHESNGDDLLQLARKRKERDELEAIASVGQRTEQVVDSVRSVLRRARLIDGIAYDGAEMLTLGTLKRLISSEIYRLGMLEDHETILSQGRDAGVPHSRGDAAAPLRASEPIVLDIFPADRASGYFFDFTRTFCIGEVPPRLAALHSEVLAAFQLAAERMRAGQRAADSQKLVCDFFEGRGHRTTRSHPSTVDGYVHSLGHGVGLQVHERPSFSLQEANSDLIEIGDVLTIEPGLYYPDEKIGVRIEETFWIDEEGRAVSFCRSSRALAP